MAIRSQIVADALRLIAAVGSFATSTTLLSGISNAATLHDAARKLALEKPPELENIADALMVDAESLFENSRELPPDAEILLVQMARETRVTPDILIDADLDPARIAHALAAPLSGYPPEMQQLFKAIAEATITRLLAPQATKELHTRILGELLKRQAETIRTIDNLTAEFGTLAEALRVISGRSQSAATHRRQMDALAGRFDIPSPHKLDDDTLHDLLAKKANEAEENRERLTALTASSDRAKELKAKAQKALGDLDFDAAQRAYGQILTDQLSDAAQTFEVMATTALLANQTEQAFRLLTTAADSFAAHDPHEALARRQRYARLLADHGRRYGSNALEYTFETLQTAIHTEVAVQYPHLYAMLLNDFGLSATGLAQRHRDSYGQALAEKGVEAFLASIAIGKTEPDVPSDVVARAQHNLATLAMLIAERLPLGEDWQRMVNNAAEVVTEALTFYADAGNPEEIADTRMSQALVLLHLAVRLPDDENTETWLRHAMSDFANALETYHEGADHQRTGTAFLNLASTASLLARFEEEEETLQLHNLASKSIDRATEEFALQENPVMLRRAILAQTGILTRFGKFIGGEDGRALAARSITLLDQMMEGLKQGHDPVFWATTLETRARIGVDLAHLDPENASTYLEAAQADVETALEAVAGDDHEATRAADLIEAIAELKIQHPAKPV